MNAAETFCYSQALSFRRCESQCEGCKQREARRKFLEAEASPTAPQVVCPGPQVPDDYQAWWESQGRHDAEVMTKYGCALRAWEASRARRSQPSTQDDPIAHANKMEGADSVNPEHYACKVCGAIPDEQGTRRHGKGCYTQSSDGGGEDYVEECDHSLRTADSVEGDVTVVCPGCGLRVYVENGVPAKHNRWGTNKLCDWTPNPGSEPGVKPQVLCEVVQENANGRPSHRFVYVGGRYSLGQQVYVTTEDPSAALRFVEKIMSYKRRGITIGTAMVEDAARRAGLEG